MRKERVNFILLEKRIQENNIEVFCLKTKSKKNSWLLCSAYNPYKSLPSYHLQEIAKGLKFYSINFDNEQGKVLALSLCG